MDDNGQTLPLELAGQADFDSRGEFQVDWVRAREQLEVHLGLWPEDYLCFLVQAACASSARRLRLSATWNALVWEWDGQALSREQLDQLFPLEQARVDNEALARLHLALYLLSRSRYRRGRFACGFGEQGAEVQWSEQGARVRARPRRGPVWAHRLELRLPPAQIGLRWLLTRRSALFTLPEYAAVKARMSGSPLQLVVPWKQEHWAGAPELFAIALRGPYSAPESPPLPADHVYIVESEGDYSAWFVSSETRCETRSLIWGLAYEGPERWRGGSLWLYHNGLRTDLAQKQLLQGPLLQSLVRQVERQLNQVLTEQVFVQHQQEARNWFLGLLTRYLTQREDSPFPGVYELPLFATAAHGPASLQQLDRWSAEWRDTLYFCTDPEALSLPEGAPPLVVLQPDVASILRSRYPRLHECGPLLQELRLRQEQQRLWASRSQESLLVPDALYREPLPVANWQGEIGLLAAPAPARLDVFVEQRWLAAVPLPNGFPPGYVGRVQSSELPVNATWTEPVLQSETWQQLVQALWLRLPVWLAELLEQPPVPAWLRARALDLVQHHERPDRLESVPLLAVGEQLYSVCDFRAAVQEQSLHQWLWRGWNPADHWKLLARVAGEGDLYRWWRSRLDSYARQVRRWREAEPRPVELPAHQEKIGLLRLPQERGEIAMRPLPAVHIQLFAYREGRLLAEQSLPGLPYALNGLPDGLQVAVNHEQFVPDLETCQIPTLGEVWNEVQAWIAAQLPELVVEVLRSRYVQRDLLALKLLAWLPRDRWPLGQTGVTLVRRLDGGEVSVAAAIECLDQGPPVRVLVDAGELAPLDDFADVWLIGREVRSEIAALWGPSRLHDCQDEYLTALMLQEQGQVTPLEPVLSRDSYLYRDKVAGGEAGILLQKGPANRARVRILRQGHPLCEGWLELGDAHPHLDSDFALECVVEVPDSPVLASFAAWSESEVGKRSLQALRDQLRWLAFSEEARLQPLLRTYRWERLACEAGASETLNSGFGSQVDELRRRLLPLPLFPLDGSLWSLEQVLRYLEEEGRLGYVLGDPIPVSAGPILYVSARELAWLKLLLGNTRLANLSHLRSTLRERQERAEAPALASLALPEVDYVLRGELPEGCWGLQWELNGSSSVQIFHRMRPVEVLRFNWRYQVQACLNLPSLERNEDGSVRRNSVLLGALERLREAVQEAIVAEAPAHYRLELAFWFWGAQEEWARQLQAQPLLLDPRGETVSVSQWVSAWSDEVPLPYVLQGECVDDPALWELLPPRPVPLLAPDLLPAASAWLAGLQSVREGLRVAWKLWHEQQPCPPPAGASFHWNEKGTRLWADPVWTQQKVRFTWRGRLFHSLSRPGWPGYELEIDCSERLLGQPLPGWNELEPLAAPYRRYLHNLLQHPDLLEDSRELWEQLPVPPTLEVALVASEPDDTDLRLQLGRIKAEWQIREQDRFAPLQRACQCWWGVPVEVRVDPDMSGPARYTVTEEGDARILWFNPMHRWFAGQPVKVVALRLTAWLQRIGVQGWRENATLRVQLLKELGLLEDCRPAQEEG